MTALDIWTNAALKLAARYERTRRVAELDRAIALFSRVVRAGADVEPDRAGHLDNLGVALLSRYEATADVAALEQALACSRAAAADRFAGHPHHALHLSNLGNTALAWFDERHDPTICVRSGYDPTASATLRRRVSSYRRLLSGSCSARGRRSSWRACGSRRHRGCRAAG